MSKIIDGRQVAETLLTRLRSATQDFIHNYGCSPSLAVIRVGHDSSSQIYVGIKRQRALDLGFQFKELFFGENTFQEEILQAIHGLNTDPTIHGILLQLPLPSHLDKQTLIKALDPKKDVDGLHPYNAGLLAQGSTEGFVPCTPLGCLKLLENVYQGLEPLQGKQALVIGRSILVGRPLAALLLNYGCTVTIAHSKTLRLEELCQRADILISAIGQPRFIKGEWIQKGAVVLDVGINRLSSELIVGDIDYGDDFNRFKAMSPVPGGVGPMTVAYLLRNTLVAAYRSCGKEPPEGL